MGMADAMRCQIYLVTRPLFPSPLKFFCIIFLHLPIFRPYPTSLQLPSFSFFSLPSPPTPPGVSISHFILLSILTLSPLHQNSFLPIHTFPPLFLSREMRIGNFFSFFPYITRFPSKTEKKKIQCEMPYSLFLF